MFMRYPVDGIDGILVDVYRNLHNGMWSVRAVQGDYRGMVIAHSEELTLCEVVFKVNESGRLRVNELKRKEVHAVVRGYLKIDELPCTYLNDVYYNPYKTTFFVDLNTGEELRETYEVVKFDRNKKVKIYQK